MFKTKGKFLKQVKKTVQSDGKWYCFYGETCRQGDTKQEAIDNAYNMWKGKDKK